MNGEIIYLAGYFQFVFVLRSILLLSYGNWICSRVIFQAAPPLSFPSP